MPRVLLFLCLVAPLVATAATPVLRAHPVSYELVRLDDEAGGEVLATGEALLREGRTETLTPAAGTRVTRLRIALSARPAERAEPGLVVDTEVDMRVADGTRRTRIGDSGESFIEAPRTREVRFANRSWRQPPGAEPIRVTHAAGGERYRLTLRFRD